MRRWLIAGFAAASLLTLESAAAQQRARSGAETPLPPARPKDIGKPAKPAAEPTPPLQPSVPPPSRQREPPWFVARQTLPATITMRCALESGVEIRFVYERAVMTFRLEPGGAHRIAASRFMDDMLVLQAETEGERALSARIGARSFLSFREGDGRLRLLPCFDLDAPE